VGQRVKQGEKIGEVGETGRAFGSHVHFEVRKNDVRLNPERYMYTGTKTIHD
jgi:murein DD-endopeptidase MepM/ murein hydrolase activator NlpD